MADKPNLTQLMNMAQQMQKNMQEMQKSLVHKKVTGKSGTGEITVEVVMNGLQQVESVTIGSAAMKEGPEILGDMVVAAVNDAVEKIKQLTKDAMIDIYQKSGVPFSDEETGGE